MEATFCKASTTHIFFKKNKKKLSLFLALPAAIEVCHSILEEPSGFTQI